MIFVPIGGGGLIAGLALRREEPEARLPQGHRRAGRRCAQHGGIPSGREDHHPPAWTPADGIKVKTPASLTFEMCHQYVDEIVTVSEDEIASAILTVLEKQKLVAEGAGAVGIAAAMYGKVNTEGKTVCALLSGGNAGAHVTRSSPPWAPT